MRRFARIAARVLLWTLVGVLGLVGLAAIALQFKAVRGLLRDQALAAVRGSLRGDLYVDDVRWPSLGQFELSGVSLHDRAGRPVLTLPSLIVRIRLRELLHERVQIDRVELDHPYIDLADFGDEEGLLSVFGSDEPKPPAPEPPPDKDFSPVLVQIDQLCIGAGQVALQPDDARQLLLHRIQGCATLHMGRNLTIGLDELRAELQNRGQKVLELVPRSTLAALSTLAADGGSGDQTARLGLAGKLSLRQAMSYDGYLQLRQLTAASLTGLGVEASWLHAPLNADLHAHSPGGQIEFRADAMADTSRAHVHGEWTADKQLHARLESEHLELRHFSASQLQPLAFQLEARADLANPTAIALEAELTRARLGGLELPNCSVKGQRLASGAIELASFNARQGKALISAQGRLEADGGMRARAELSLPELERLPATKLLEPDLSGGLSGNVQFQRTATGLITTDIALNASSLQLRNNVASAIELHAHASGALERPTLNLTLQARQLTLGAEHIPNASLEVAGGPARYELHASADNRALALSGWAAVDEPGYRGGFELQAELDKEPLHAAVNQVSFVPGSHLQVDQLRAEYLGARAFADGRVQLAKPKQEHSSLRFAVTVPELSKLTQQFTQSALPGRIEAVGVVHGRVEEPAIEARLRWQNGPALGKYASELALYAKAELAEGRASANLQASAGHARAQVDLRSSWKKGVPLSAAIKNARHDLRLNTRSVPIEELAGPGSKPAPAGLRGLLGGELTAQGNQHKFEVATHWQAELRAGRDPNALALQVEGSYKDAKLALGLKADDAQGRFLEFDASQDLNVEQLMAAARPLTELVDQSAWQTKAKFEKRRLRELPLVRGLGLDRELTPLTVATTLEVDHAPGQEPKGAWKTELAWEPGESGRSELVPCSADAQSGAIIGGKLENGDFAFEATVHSDDDEVARFASGVHVRLRDALQGRFDHVGPTGITAELTKFDLHKIPLLCDRGSGVVDAQLTGKDLFAPAADFQLKFSGKGLQWYESDPLTLDANAHSDGDQLAVRARFHTGEGELQVDGTLPIGFRGKDPLLIVNRAGPVALKTRFQKVDLPVLLAYVPGIARSSGRVHGGIDVRGTLQKPSAHGQLQLEDVSFTLPRLGQRFSHLNMKAAVDDRSLRLSDGKFRDLDGSASIAARITFDRPDAWDAELNLNVRNFPVRKSGLMMGRADADIKAVARSTPSEMGVTVTLNNVAIQLTSNSMGDVQSLDPDPEIQFTDALSTRPNPKPTDEGETTTTAAPTIISIETPEPIWVRRDDFAVQMRTKLKIMLGREHPDMRGTIDLSRGYLSVLGQNFDIKSGRVTFTGGDRVDPQLEIKAENTTPSGSKVGLNVTGFVQAPKLAFTINNQSATAGDAIMAMTGRGDSGAGKGFEDQVASAAIGMTTGLLSLGARREFGDWVPMLSVDAGAQTRVRVGVEADRFIPKFMRSFVHGAYVEGIVSSGQSSDSSSVGAETNTASGTGVLLELMLPKSFVAAGQYGPGTAWSVDLDWRP